MLAPEEIVEILGRYLADAVPGWEEQLAERRRIPEQLAMYLGLLLKWNERTNLTAIRDPSEIVRRHFGESLFAAVYVKGSGSLLDYGSGAGFPGVPIQLWHPELRVTLAESQGKKAAFLREVLRSLELPTEVWSRRAEELLPERRFDAVVMRAVDGPQRALGTAFELTRAEVWVLGSEALVGELAQGVRVESRVALPQTHGSFLFQLRRDVFHVERSFGA